MIDTPLDEAATTGISSVTETDGDGVLTTVAVGGGDHEAAIRDVPNDVTAIETLVAASELTSVGKAERENGMISVLLNGDGPVLSGR